MAKQRSRTTVSDSTSTRYRDITRKSCSSLDHEDVIPVPIQIFLWRQSNPFIKQKFGNLTDASAISFNRVLVQNILHGLSPSLSNAIASIPRWLLIKASLPHVMHACSSTMLRSIHQPSTNIHPTLLLPSALTQLQIPTSLNPIPPTISIDRQSIQSTARRVSSVTNIHSSNTTEIQLFQTLDYLLLNANEKNISIDNKHCLPLNTIQLFIYLFVPYIITYLRNNEKDFLANPDLVQGMQLIWQPLFDYRQPNIRVFNAFVKPMTSSQAIDNNHHRHNCLPILIESPIPRWISEKQPLADLTNQPIVNIEESYTNLFQPIIKIAKEQELNTFINADSDTTPTTNNSITDLSTCEMLNNNVKKRAPLVHMHSICSVSDLSRLTISPIIPDADKFDVIPGISSSTSAPSISIPIHSSQQPADIPHASSTHTALLSKTAKAYPSEHILFATYFDIGILRTLFSPSWLTDGYLWCLEYLHKRMIDISDEVLADALKTGRLPINILRFKSLSIPQINTVNEQNYYEYLKNSYFNEQITNDIIKQQCTMAGTDEITTTKQPARLLNIPFEYFSEKSLHNDKPSRKHDNFYKKISQIHYIDEEGIEHLDLAITDNFEVSSATTGSHPFHLTELKVKTSTINPARESADSNTRQMSGTTNLNAMKKFSVSDSEINYKFLEEIEQAQGSSRYINRSGTINFGVILAGIHAVICKEHHLKICELAINILDVLFGLAVISSTEDDIYKNQLLNIKNDEKGDEHAEEWFKQINAKEDEKFQLAVDITLRILKRLGCPNCQPRARGFTVDQLRGKIRLSLNKLRLLNQRRFEKCFLNLTLNSDLAHIFDIFHALCGYCSDSNVSLAHYAPYIPTKTETYSRQTYSNNFGNTHLGIDGFILNIIFKPFVIRLNSMEEYLLNLENNALYNECRAFLIYIKENHGGIFRSATFSSLIDPEKKLKILKQSIKEKFARQNKISLNPNLSDDGDGNTDQQSQTLDTEEAQSKVNAKLKSTQTRTTTLTEDEDHSLYAQQEESLYVDLTLVRLGLLRLNFLMQSCPPGSLPDPQFLNSLLLLDAPVISKAAYLVECAYFVRCCSLGQWPEWMRINIATYRPHDAISGRMHGNINSKLSKIYQAAAARMFYIWGEALSSQLEVILDTEKQQQNSSTTLWDSDENFEDYYNEAIVNRSDHECPYSLKLVVCLLLYEITSFLREQYEILPKLSSISSTTGVNSHRQQLVIDTSSGVTGKPSSNRLRMGSVVSQASNISGASFSSEQPPPSSQGLSATIVNMNTLVNERHISFALNKENDSAESNHTAIVMNDDDDGVGIIDGNSISVSVPTNKTGSASKSKIIRRTSAKLRKPSIRMKDAGKNSHRSSFRTRRRSHASSISTDIDGHQNTIGSATMETTNDYRTINDQEEVDQENFDHTINTRPFPWIKVIIRILNNINLTCDHQTKCLANCYDKQTRSCKNLIKALLNMYQLSSSSSFSRSSSSMITNLKRNLQDFKKPRTSTNVFADQTVDPHFTKIITYLEKQVGSLIQIPLMILCKSSVLLEEEHYSQILHLSWELLLDQNEELSACAATLVILTAARAGHLVDGLIHKEMKNSSALIRYNSILKFEILWRFRYQFWIRLEDGAHSMMKILPPSIEFVLPSPVLGIANLQIVDPPWMPHVKTLVEQVAINQEEVRAVVTASKTRKKHQQELIHSALMTKEISKQVARENFAMSTVSMLQAASFEPILHQSKDEEEDAHTDDDRMTETGVQIRQAQGTFPSAFSPAVFHLVEMLEDEEVIENGAIVSGAARKALWTCLVDEPTLLIRFFFEKLSHKERRIKSLQSLRRLMICLTDIPSQFAHAIFNYVLGLLMSMMRSTLDDSQELITAGLTLLWQVIPYLHGLVLKDLKRVLRKEQAEMMILITGNIPSTKKVIIHGSDQSQIPTQAIIAEDTQFSNVLQEALEFFGIPDVKRDRYHLIDIKTQQILIPDTYVRDFYFFRRNIYPQLALVYMDIKQSQQQLEQTSMSLKTTELSKVLFARYLLENTPFNQIHNCITFFHDELIKSPLFPRKPLESDFNLYTKILDKELFNLDMLHKYNWIKLISCIFTNMDGKTTTTWDITLFLDVINGSFILHCEDLAMLRFCLATYINIVKHFRHIFATNGYLLIMPTLLLVYSNIQSNPMLKKAIEYCCRQFFILHRIPFILQMLGSISQLLDFDEQADITDTNKIQPISLFRLLIALEQTNGDTIRDDYLILELVKSDSSSATKPIITATASTTVVPTLGQGNMIAPTSIKSLDFCYADDDTIFTLLNCFDVCVTVVAYAPDSIRSLQMLGIIDLLLPKYLEYLKDRTNKADAQKQGREELKIIEKLSIAIKTLINASESLTRAFVGPKHEPLLTGSYKRARSSYRLPSIAPDEDSMSRFIDDRTKSRAQDADERKQASEYRWPRDTFLSVISNFIYFSTQRLKELIKIINDRTLRLPELLDAKSHTRLADIAHTLLKLGGFDPVTMSCRGIQNYFQKLLPYTNWSQEELQPALNLLLRRIDRIFSKICKKPLTKHCFDWEATAEILNGIYLTIHRHPYVAYFPNLKALVSGCIALILNENIADSGHSVPRMDTPTIPQEFSRAVIKLVGRYLLTIKNQPSLEILTSNSWSPGNVSSAINHLLHFLLPLMFWAGNGRKDAPKFHSMDISYVITILLSSVKPSLKLASAMGRQSGQPAPIGSSGKQHLTVGDVIPPNINVTHKSMRQLKDLLQTASLLGLKVLMIGFDKQLKREWLRITQAIKLMCHKQSNISSNLLSFIDFIVSYKTPIYVILRPFLLHYMHSASSENGRDYELITSVQQKLIFEKITPSKSVGEILNELMQELNQLKAELTDEPSTSVTNDIRPTGTEKVRFDTEVLDRIKYRNDTAARTDTMSDERSNVGQLTNTYRFRRQQLSDNSLNTSPKKKTERLRVQEALDILEIYNARYRIRSGVAEVSVSNIPTKEPRDLTRKHLSVITNETTTDTLRLQSSVNSSPSVTLLRSVTLTGDRSSSNVDRSFQYSNPMDQSTINDQVAPKLRTFRGWKRNTAHLDKSRLTKSSLRSRVSNDSAMTYDATKEMNTIFRPIRQISEQHIISVINEQTSDFIDTGAVNDNDAFDSLFKKDTFPINDQISTSSAILSRQTESQAEICLTDASTDTDDEFQL